MKDLQAQHNLGHGLLNNHNGTEASRLGHIVRHLGQRHLFKCPMFKG
jgi:hypothetical protein